MKNKHIILFLASSFVLAGCGNKTPEHTHVFGEWINLDADNHQKSCECGETIKAPHNFGEGVIEKEASLDEEGSIKYTCSDCGATKIENYSLSEEEKKQCAYEMIFTAYDYLENYTGDFGRSCTFNLSNDGAAYDSYTESIVYDSETKESLYRMNKNEEPLYEYFNKKDPSDDSYSLYVSTTLGDRKSKYLSNEDCIDHLMNIYDNPERYTEYSDVLVQVDDFLALDQTYQFFNPTNSEKLAFLNQNSYRDGLEYFKEYFTLVISESSDDEKFADLSPSFNYEKADGKTIVNISGTSSTLLKESYFEGGCSYVDIEVGYTFKLDDKCRLDSVERSLSFEYRNFKEGTEIETSRTTGEMKNIESFDYDIGDWTLNEDTEGYTDTNTYPLYSLDIQLFQTCDGLPFSSSGSLTNFVGDGNIDFNYLDNVVDIIPNQYEIKYRKEGTKIEKVYLDPECTKEFTGTDMKIGELTLYCTYDYLDNVCIATERYITDISAYGYKFGNEILFDDRLEYSSESNFIDFSGKKEIKFDESDFEIHPNPIGDFTLQSVTIDDVTYDKEALLEGVTYDLNNGTVITKNYGLVNQ